MNPQDLRLECIKLALSKSDTAEEAVKEASLLEEYISGEPRQPPCSTGDKD